VTVQKLINKAKQFKSSHTFLVQVSIDDDCVFPVQEKIGAVRLTHGLVDLISGVIARSQRMKLYVNIHMFEHATLFNSLTD